MINTKNIYKNGNYYQIRKYFDGKMHFFGTYRSLGDAIKVRDVLDEVNYGLPNKEMRYISKHGKQGYRVRKTRNYEVIWDCIYPTLEMAMYERDLLESADWDVDEIGEEPNGKPMKVSGKVIFEKHNKPRRDWYLTRRDFYD